MIRRPIALALAALLSPLAAHATDLMQTFEMARSGDPQLASAESGRLAQKEGAVQARALLLPQLNGSASFTRSNSKPEGGSWSDTGKSRDYGVSLSQSVFDYSRISSLRSQKALSHAADFDLESANDSLIVRTSAAYFNVLVAIDTVSAAEASEAAYKKQFDYAQKRLEVGLAPITDVHEARASYDGARATTIEAKNSLKDAYQALEEITGQPVNRLMALPADFRPELPAGKDANAWVATALDSNPALKSLDYQVKSAEADVSTARAGHLPTLSLSGSYGRGATWGGSTVGTGSYSTNGSADSKSIGLSLNVPIFAGGGTQSKVRAALAQRDMAQDSFEQQRRSIIRNTRNAYNTLEAGISEVEARRLALVSAQSAYEASQVGLEVGTRTVLDVLQNQRTLFSAEQDYSTAKYNYLQNRLLLAQAAGTLNIDDLQDINRLLTADAEIKRAPNP